MADVARHLKLAVRQIEALEADDFKNLPPITFVRGFIRNYAKLVQIDATPLLKVTEPMLPTPQVPENDPGVAEIPTVSDKRFDWKAYTLSGVLTVLLLVFFAYEWYQDKHEKPSSPPPVSVTRERVPDKKDKPEVPGKSIVEPVPAPPEIAQSTTAAMPEPSEEKLAPAHGRSEIRLEFVEASWVEITDKHGKTIFSQLGPAGSVQSVRGTPPLAVVVGNAAGLKLLYNDKAVDLKPYTKIDVARLTLE